MNEITQNEVLNLDQVLRLKGLIQDMVKCCEDRRLYEHGRFGLPWAELRCLMFFSGEHYLTVKQIAEKMDVAKSRITKIVDQLVKKGMVTRLDDPADARVRLIGLTASGRAKVLEIDGFHKDIHRKVLSYIPPEDRAALLFFLEKLKEAMNTAKQELER